MKFLVALKIYKTLSLKTKAKMYKITTKGKCRSKKKKVRNSKTRSLATAFLVSITIVKAHTGEYNRPHLKRRVDLARALAKHGGCDCGGSIALVSIELDDDATMQ